MISPPRRLEPAQVAVLDQVVRMLVMARIADMRADVVQERCKFQPLALAIGQAVRAARLVEDREAQSRHLIRVLRPVAAALGELDDAAAAHVRVLPGLRDVLPVALNVIEDEAFAKREVAQRDLARVEVPQDGVEAAPRPTTMRSARRGSRPGIFMRSAMLRSTTSLRTR